MSSPTTAHATGPVPPAPPSATTSTAEGTLTTATTLSTTATGSGPSGSGASPTQTAPLPHIRIVPHLDAPRSLHFDVVDKDVPEGFVLKIGRFTDKQALPNRVTFKSKVVSRGHAEIFTENGKFYIRDTKSSSGTFLNHARLSAPGVESKPTLLKDGDVIQLGVDYQGGTQEIYRCVKMRLELNRSWQQQANPFRTNTLKAIRSLTTADASCSTDCCICLFRIASFQSLFVAPCSHVYHYKCIRPMLVSNHPGFLCPLCRTFADLEDTVEIDDPIEEESPVETGSAALAGNGATSRQDSVEHLSEPEHATDAPMTAVASPPNEQSSSTHEIANIASSRQRDETLGGPVLQGGPGSTDDLVHHRQPSSTSSASSSQQQIQTSSSSSSVSATVPPMDISGTGSGSTTTNSANALEQQSPSSAFFMAPSPPMFVTSFGVSPIPFTAGPTIPSSPRQPTSSPSQQQQQAHHVPSSPSSHMGHMIQNFVRNITIPHRNRSRTNSNSATSPTTPHAATSHPGSLTTTTSTTGLVPPPATTTSTTISSSGADVLGKTLVISPPTMMLSHRMGTTTAQSGHSELGAVSEMDVDGVMVMEGGEAMMQAGSSGGHSSSGGSRHGSSSSRSSSQSRGQEHEKEEAEELLRRRENETELRLPLHHAQTVVIAAEATV